MLTISIIVLLHESDGNIIDFKDIWLNSIRKIDDEIIVFCWYDFDVLVKLIASNKIEVSFVDVMADVTNNFAV